jgi:hypothetical protein
MSLAGSNLLNVDDELGFVGALANAHETSTCYTPIEV